MVEAIRRHLGLGLVAMLASCAAFGTSGPFAKALMVAGWSPGAVVLARITGAAIVLMPFALWSLRGRWGSIRRELPRVARPECVVVVVDATNLERNCYLVAQVLALGLPTVVALTLTDVAATEGLEIDDRGLAARLVID